MGPIFTNNTSRLKVAHYYHYQPVTCRSLCIRHRNLGRCIVEMERLTYHQIPVIAARLTAPKLRYSFAEVTEPGFEPMTLRFRGASSTDWTTQTQLFHRFHRMMPIRKKDYGSPTTYGDIKRVKTSAMLSFAVIAKRELTLFRCFFSTLTDILISKYRAITCKCKYKCIMHFRKAILKSSSCDI